MPAILTLVQPQSSGTWNTAMVSSPETLSEVFSKSSNAFPLLRGIKVALKKKKKKIMTLVTNQLIPGPEMQKMVIRIDQALTVIPTNSPAEELLITECEETTSPPQKVGPWHLIIMERKKKDIGRNFSTLCPNFISLLSRKNITSPNKLNITNISSRICL